MRSIITLSCLVLIIHAAGAQDIPLPSGPQLRWQHYEQTMFVCLDPCTWQGREYDNHSLPPGRINPSRLDTDQWCRTALLWDARLILFVAKHTGGFCWWQTQTSTYGIKETPWKKGKGDVLKDLSRSCRKYGLDLGIYVYPGDEQWGAGIGSGGKTADPSKQEAYNRVFRQQLKEVLANYGKISEVWFDGSCVIPVSDLITEYASDAVVLQGKSASLRWVGNEDGIAPDPNWYTLRKADLETGVSTALHSTPDGDAYAPVEVDVPLLKNGGHKWFWAPGTDHLLLNTDQLMNLYYKSVGRGALLLLNSTPDTTGLIPASHVAVYKQFGDALRQRFSSPIAETSGQGAVLVLDLLEPQMVNHVILQEDLTKGQRVLSYRIDGLAGDQWVSLINGSSVGNKKIDPFQDGKYSKIRVRFLEYKTTPAIRNFAVYHIQNVAAGVGSTPTEFTIGNWQKDTYNDQWQEVRYDLTPYLNPVGEYEVQFRTVSYDFLSGKPSGLEFSDWKLELYGRDAPEAISELPGGGGIRITRSQQTLDDFPSILSVRIKSKPAQTVGDVVLRRIIYR